MEEYAKRFFIKTLFIQKMRGNKRIKIKEKERERELKEKPRLQSGHSMYWRAPEGGRGSSS